MAVGTLSGNVFDIEAAKTATGYRSDIETWPYRTLTWLASHGYEVRHIDAIDAQPFSRDPISELRRNGFDDETLAFFDVHSDLKVEADASRLALEAGVEFDTRFPREADLTQYLEEGWLPILTLDAAILKNEGPQEYQGHMALVTGYDRDTGDLLLQDSGPPAHWDWRIPLTTVFAALKSPNESSGTVTLVRRRSDRDT